MPPGHLCSHALTVWGTLLHCKGKWGLTLPILGPHTPQWVPSFLYPPGSYSLKVSGSEPWQLSPPQPVGLPSSPDRQDKNHFVCFLFRPETQQLSMFKPNLPIYSKTFCFFCLKAIVYVMSSKILFWNANVSLFFIQLIFAEHQDVSDSVLNIGNRKVNKTGNGPGVYIQWQWHLSFCLFLH